VGGERGRRPDDLGAAARAAQIAREHGGQPDRAQPRRLGGALPLPLGRQRHVEMADEAARAGALDFTVPQEVDHDRRFSHASSVSSALSSASSTEAPSTSPVRPPSRRFWNHATANATATPTASAVTPASRSVSAATRVALPRAIGAAQALTPATNDA